MAMLSALFYNLAQHPFLGLAVFPLVGAFCSGLIAHWRRNLAWNLLIVPFFLLGVVNTFAAHMLNAAFLNAFGTIGHAVIGYEAETNSQLNDQYIWEYEAILKTADGRDVVTHFDTMSASIYPIRNEILIPPKGETFVAKYIPGFERNIAIMSDLSAYGKRRLVEQDGVPVEKAAARYAASPANPAFVKGYRDALRAFIARHADDADPDMIRWDEQVLESLPPPQD
jgi:hypothetical protein